MYLLSFALVTCEDYVRTTRNSYNQQRRRKAYGHTAKICSYVVHTTKIIFARKSYTYDIRKIRPNFARMSYIRATAILVDKPYAYGQPYYITSIRLFWRAVKNHVVPSSNLSVRQHCASAGCRQRCTVLSTRVHGERKTSAFRPLYRYVPFLVALM